MYICCSTGAGRNISEDADRSAETETEGIINYLCNFGMSYIQTELLSLGICINCLVSAQQYFVHVLYSQLQLNGNQNVIAVYWKFSTKKVALTQCGH